MRHILILLALINLISLACAYDIQIAAILGSEKVQFEPIKNGTLYMVIEKDGKQDIFKFENK